MPAGSIRRWTPPESLLPLLCPYPSEAMAAYRVSTYVNNPTHDAPLCVEPEPALF